MRTESAKVSVKMPASCRYICSVTLHSVIYEKKRPTRSRSRFAEDETLTTVISKLPLYEGMQPEGAGEEGGIADVTPCGCQKGQNPSQCHPVAWTKPQQKLTIGEATATAAKAVRRASEYITQAACICFLVAEARFWSQCIWNESGQTWKRKIQSYQRKRSGNTTVRWREKISVAISYIFESPSLTSSDRLGR